MARAKVDWRKFPDTVQVEVCIKPLGKGEAHIEVWEGMTKRHAVWRARDYYRGVAQANLASGEPV